MVQAPKKDKKEETEDEVAFKEKKKAEADALKAARDKGMSLSILTSVYSDMNYSTERSVRLVEC